MGSIGGLKKTLFISHGSPTLSIDDSLPARHFLKYFTQKVSLSQRPAAILVISAHWETDTPTVNVISGPNDIDHIDPQSTQHASFSNMDKG